MTTNFILWFEIFVFILCCLNVFTNIYNVIKVIYTKSGKVETSKLSNLLFGMSLSFIIATLITGF